MKSIKVLNLLLAAFLLTLSSHAIAKKDEPPEVTEDGLHLVPDSKMALVYVDPEATLVGYQRVMLLDAHVAFKKNWERDQRRGSAATFGVSSRDMEKIKNSLSNEFNAVFKTVLEEGDYPVVEEAGDDVLLVRPAIINLDVTAPDTPTPGRSTTYATSAGEMTLYIELYDSVTGDIMAKALDRQIDRDRGYYTWTNSVTNRAAADRILKGWANILLDALKEAHGR